MKSCELVSICESSVYEENEVKYKAMWQIN